MMSQPAEDPRIGTEVAGYRIEQRIGRGGMGVVYRAEHLTLGRQAALKIIVPDLAESEGFRSRFLQEARIAATLVHPNVVTVYDAGDMNGLLYIAMQYVEGSDLAKVLRTDGRLKPFRALDVLRQVGAALDAAHVAGLVHRDVKPGNVLIQGRHAYLTDFGLTKRLSSGDNLTRPGEVVGTVHYLAPEQIEGKPVDGRTDVYALGCLLYQCLSGELPYPRDSDVAVIYAHIQDDPPKLSERRPDLPAGLDQVIAKAMEKSPDRRFATCHDLITAARGVVDAHGPLSESSGPRRTIPVEGDPGDIPTGAGRRIPPIGDSPSTPTGGHSKPPLPIPPSPKRAPLALIAAAHGSTRAVARVALQDRCEVMEADTPESAIESAKERRPDVILLDWAMSGAETAAALRGDPLTGDAKIIVLVSYKDQGKREVAASGADETLATPFSPLQLQVKLRKLLGAEAVA